MYKTPWSEQPPILSEHNLWFITAQWFANYCFHWDGCTGKWRNNFFAALIKQPWTCLVSGVGKVLLPHNPFGTYFLEEGNPVTPSAQFAQKQQIGGNESGISCIPPRKHWQLHPISNFKNLSWRGAQLHTPSTCTLAHGLKIRGWQGSPSHYLEV